MGWLGDLLFGTSDKPAIEEPTGGYVANSWWKSDHPSQQDNGDKSAETWF